MSVHPDASIPLEPPEITRVVDLKLDPYTVRKQHFRACVESRCYGDAKSLSTGSFIPFVTTTLPQPSNAVGLFNIYRRVGSVVALTGGVAASLVSFTPVISRYNIAFTLPADAPPIADPIGSTLAGTLSLTLSSPIAITFGLSSIVISPTVVALLWNFVGVDVTDTLTISYTFSYATTAV